MQLDAINKLKHAEPAQIKHQDDAETIEKSQPGQKYFRKEAVVCRSW